MSREAPPSGRDAPTRRLVTTPRVLWLTVLLLGASLLAWRAEVAGWTPPHTARAVWALSCLLIMGAIVQRARAHWAGWKARQLRSR